jgi:hypothetical protein
VIQNGDQSTIDYLKTGTPVHAIHQIVTGLRPSVLLRSKSEIRLSPVESQFA